MHCAYNGRRIHQQGGGCILVMVGVPNVQVVHRRMCLSMMMMTMLWRMGGASSSSVRFPRCPAPGPNQEVGPELGVHEGHGGGLQLGLYPGGGWRAPRAACSQADVSSMMMMTMMGGASSSSVRCPRCPASGPNQHLGSNLTCTKVTVAVCSSGFDKLTGTCMALVVGLIALQQRFAVWAPACHAHKQAELRVMSHFPGTALALLAEEPGASCRFEGGPAQSLA